MIDCYVKEVWKQKVETAVLVSGKASPSWKDWNSQSMEKVRCWHVRLCATDIVGIVVKQSTSLDVILDNQQEHWFIWENFLISWQSRDDPATSTHEVRIVPNEPSLASSIQFEPDPGSYENFLLSSLRQIGEAETEKFLVGCWAVVVGWVGGQMGTSGQDTGTVFSF